MKIKPYVDKLYASEKYKEFQKEHKNAFIAAGFFVLDLEEGKHIHQIDFYVPKEKKVAAFTLDHGIKVQMMKLINSKVPERLDLQTKVDLEALKGILEDEMKNRNITESIKKIIAVLQNLDGKKIWNVNCVLSGMGILRAHIEDETQSVLKMEKSNIMDYIQKISPSELQKMQTALPQAKVNSDEKNNSLDEREKFDGKDLKKAKLKQLEALEAEIEREKKELMKTNKINKNSNKNKQK